MTTFKGKLLETLSNLGKVLLVACKEDVYTDPIQ